MDHPRNPPSTWHVVRGIHMLNPCIVSDAAVTIPEKTAVPEGLTELVIPAGRYARATHVGPYEGLGRTWTLVMGKWLPGSGHRLGDGERSDGHAGPPGSSAI